MQNDIIEIAKQIADKLEEESLKETNQRKKAELKKWSDIYKSKDEDTSLFRIDIPIFFTKSERF